MAIKLKDFECNPFVGFHAEIWVDEELYGAFEGSFESPLKYVWVSKRKEEDFDLLIRKLPRFRVDGEDRELDCDGYIKLLVEKQMLMRDVERYRKTRTYFRKRGWSVNEFSYVEFGYSEEIEERLLAAGAEIVFK